MRAQSYGTYIHHSKAFFALIMNLEALKAKIDKVPKNAGTKDQPHLFHVGPGSQKKSILYHLQYGKSSERRKMRVRECNSSGLILECSHARAKSQLKCKATVKLQVLDPKMLKVKFVTKGNKPKEINQRQNTN